MLWCSFTTPLELRYFHSLIRYKLVLHDIIGNTKYLVTFKGVISKKWPEFKGSAKQLYRLH